MRRAREARGKILLESAGALTIPSTPHYYDDTWNRTETSSPHRWRTGGAGAEQRQRIGRGDQRREITGPGYCCRKKPEVERGRIAPGHHPEDQCLRGGIVSGEFVERRRGDRKLQPDQEYRDGVHARREREADGRSVPGRVREKLRGRMRRTQRGPHQAARSDERHEERRLHGVSFPGRRRGGYDPRTKGGLGRRQGLQSSTHSLLDRKEPAERRAERGFPRGKEIG